MGSSQPLYTRVALHCAVKIRLMIDRSVEKHRTEMLQKIDAEEELYGEMEVQEPANVF